MKTLTPELSRLARQELGGISQNTASKEAGIPCYIIKHWESGRFRPPAAQLEKLRAFYEAQGVDFGALADHLSQQAAAAPPAPAPTTEAPRMPAGFTVDARPGFFVAPSLSAELVGRLMERMEANDDRIAALVGASFDVGMWGDPTPETDERVRKLMGTLAENHLIFRMLQGRSIVARTPGDARREPATVGDFLSDWATQEPAVAELVDATAPAPKTMARGNPAPAGVAAVG